MTISGVNPYASAVPSRPAAGPAVQRPVGDTAAAASPATASTVRSASLWQVLTPEEKAFFLGAAAQTTLGYTPAGGLSTGGEPVLGCRLDVRA